MTGLSAATKRKYAIIVALVTHNTPTLADISKLTEIPESSLKRLLALIRTDLGMDIRFVSNGNNKGRTGNYHIYDWGVLDRAKFLVSHGSILEQ